MFSFIHLARKYTSLKQNRPFHGKGPIQQYLGKCLEPIPSNTCFVSRQYDLIHFCSFPRCRSPGGLAGAVPMGHTQTGEASHCHQCYVLMVPAQSWPCKWPPAEQPPQPQMGTFCIFSAVGPGEDPQHPFELPHPLCWPQRCCAHEQPTGRQRLKVESC